MCEESRGGGGGGGNRVRAECGARVRPEGIASSSFGFSSERKGQMLEVLSVKATRSN